MTNTNVSRLQRIPENVDDVLSDHNLPHKRVVALSVELRRKGQPALPWEEDWIARVGFGAERRYRSLPLEVNRVSFAIANPDRSWALLLADELEPQVVRTLRGPRIGGWLIYPATVLIATGLVALGDSLSDQVTLLQTFQQPPSLFKMIVTSVGGLFLVWMFRSVEPLSSLI